MGENRCFIAYKTPGGHDNNGMPLIIEHLLSMKEVAATIQDLNRLNAEEIVPFMADIHEKSNYTWEFVIEHRINVQERD